MLSLLLVSPILRVLNLDQEAIERAFFCFLLLCRLQAATTYLHFIVNIQIYYYAKL